MAPEPGLFHLFCTPELWLPAILGWPYNSPVIIIEADSRAANLLWCFEVRLQSVGERPAGLQQLPPGHVQLGPLVVREVGGQPASRVQQ